MDEETVRTRVLSKERKHREEEMIASAIVSEAVDLEVSRGVRLFKRVFLCEASEDW